jgi:biotin carboxyl carrier protein
MKYKVKVNNKEYIVEVEELDNNTQINNDSNNSDVFNNAAKIKDNKIERVDIKPKIYSSSNIIESPLSGEVIKIFKNVGDQVSYGDTIFILEAMKMENSVTAMQDGKIKSIDIKLNEIVKQGTKLAEIE